jgi:glycine hydroxymethyltransferase
MIDGKILRILAQEKIRQRNTIELIASENFASQEVMDLCGSVFTNKYAEGLPGKRYYNGCEHADDIEQYAIDLATKIFNCRFGNVQPHSGANANLAVFKAFLKPGDTILGMDLSAGGHLSHGSPVNISGKWFNAISYPVDSNGFIDYDLVHELAIEHRPKMLIAGASAYSRIINWKRMSEIAREVDAIFLCDVSHYSGLIAGDVYPNAFPYADVVTSTTHKTLRGPRGGIILWNNPDYSKKINSAVFPGTQGGPLMHIIAAKAQCFHEADTEEFKTYARNVVENAMAMTSTLINGYNIDIVTAGTDSHMFTIDLRKEKYSGREYADMLEKNGITVNKNSVPGDTRSFVETSGVRIGTAAETTRGYSRKQFQDLAHQMASILRS